MKKINFKKIGTYVKNFAKGAISAPAKPIIGGVFGFLGGMKSTADENIQSECGGQGHVNWPHLTGAAISILLITLFAFGKITIADLERLLHYFNQ